MKNYLSFSFLALYLWGMYVIFLPDIDKPLLSRQSAIATAKDGRTDGHGGSAGPSGTSRIRGASR